MILHSSQIRKNIARLNCTSGVATAFLVSPRIALTALHAVEEEKELITLEFFNLGESKKKVKARRISKEEDVDVAILQLDEEVIIDEYLEITSSLIPHDLPWETYGYPIINGCDECRVKGDISKVDEYYNPKNWDVDLSRNVNIVDFRGLSGAPLIVNGEVRGIILVQSQNSLGAISVKKFLDLLNKYNISYSKEIDGSIPKELKESINKDILNFDTLDQIENKIKEIESGIIILTGLPGSGKTITSAMINPISKNVLICGRYFVKIPNDKYSIAFRASDENFARWFESSITKILYKSLPPEREYNTNEFIKIINEYFDKLSVYLLKQEKIGVFIIDGIDDVANLGVENLNRFLSLIPNKIPDSIVILLSCVSKEILPMFIQGNIDEEKNHIAMKSLELQTYEPYLYNEVSDDKPQVKRIETEPFTLTGNKMNNMNKNIELKDRTFHRPYDDNENELSLRFNKIFDLINSSKKYSKFTIEELAYDMKLEKSGILRRYFTGEDEPTFKFLEEFSQHFGINSDWLKFGHAQPYKSMENGELKAVHYYDKICSYNPRAIYFVRVKETGESGIILKLSKYKYITLPKYYNISSKVGSTGRSQILSFYNLIKVLNKNGYYTKCRGIMVDEKIFIDIFSGKVFPGTVDDLYDKENPWWDDFLDIHHSYPIAQNYGMWYGDEFLAAQTIVKEELTKGL